MRRYTLLIITILLAYNCFAWGRVGHAAIAQIAENHLTEQAKKNMSKALDGHSIVFYASWLDNYRIESKKLDKLRHSAQYDIETHEPAGRGLKELNSAISKLNNYKSLSDSTFKATLYQVIHTVGDFHCPGHTYFVKTDQNGKLKYVHNTHYLVRILNENKPTMYHPYWDSLFLSYGGNGAWGFADIAYILDRLPEDEVAKIQSGTVESWLKWNADKFIYIYDRVPQKPKDAPFEELSVIDQRTLNEFFDAAMDQILVAGLRLAKVLNNIFDK